MKLQSMASSIEHSPAVLDQVSAQRFPLVDRRGYGSDMEIFDREDD